MSAVSSGPAGPPAAAGAPAPGVSVNAPAGPSASGRERNDRDVQLRRRLDDRRFVAIQHDHRLGAEIGQVKLKLFSLIGRIERRGGGAGGERDKSGCHLRAVRQHNGDTVVAADAGRVENAERGLAQRPQAVIS